MKKLHFLSLGLIAILCFSAMKWESHGTKPLKAPEGFSMVPSGKVWVDTSEVTIQAFFISKTEISNRQYREFLKELLTTGDTSSYRKALVDTLAWRSPLAYNEPLVEFYFRHPAYDDYPVVNVSYEGAQLYCQWLTKKMQSFSNRLKAEFRLPYREEWIYAGLGGTTLSEYSWGGYYLRNSDGQMCCNFKNISAENIHYNSETKKYEVILNAETGQCGGTIDELGITAPVKSYKPNNYGIYNMCGNVAEMTNIEGIAVGGSWQSSGYDVRLRSCLYYSKPEPSIGFRPIITFVTQ